jgi:hypothetical protein
VSASGTIGTALLVLSRRYEGPCGDPMTIPTVDAQRNRRRAPAAIPDAVGRADKAIRTAAGPEVPRPSRGCGLRLIVTVDLAKVIYALIFAWLLS